MCSYLSCRGFHRQAAVTAAMFLSGMPRIALLDSECKLSNRIKNCPSPRKLIIISDSLALCGLYHVFWVHILPYFGGYRIRQELVVLDDETAKVHRLVKIPVAELETWDKEHDSLGQKLTSRSSDVYERETEPSTDEKYEQL